MNFLLNKRYLTSYYVMLLSKDSILIYVKSACSIHLLNVKRTKTFWSCVIKDKIHKLNVYFNATKIFLTYVK